MRAAGRPDAAALRRAGGGAGAAAAGRGRRAVAVRAAGSTFGTAFRVTTFGESHGKGVGCIVDGVPPRLSVSKEEVQAELDRRRPGQSRITTPRKESDTCDIYSGADICPLILCTLWSCCLPPCSEAV